jgi:nitrite reductase/ring-hydroxylating ferredoxin subunit
MEADRSRGALARRGFLAGLVGVCSGCVLSACSAAGAPAAGPYGAAASSGTRTGRPSGPTASSGGPGHRHGTASSRTPSPADEPTTASAATTPSTSRGDGAGGDGSTGGHHASRSPSASSEPPQHTRSPTPSPSQTTSDPGMALAALSSVPVGGAFVVQRFRVVLTQPTAGVVHGFSALCTHQGCIVGDGAGELLCPCHGSRFSMTDGSVIQGPAQNPLPAQRVRVVNGYVYPA